jgi:hypothetical protein
MLLPGLGLQTPRGRGTWGILYSCVFTLVLCVYTAIHLNLPAKNNTQYTIWLRKIKWVLIAIFGPEVVVLTALDQLLSARQFLRNLRSPHYNIDKVGLKQHSIVLLSISCLLTLPRIYWRSSTPTMHH